MTAAYFLTAYFALNAVAGVALIGKRRDPITPAAAVVMLFLYAALIWVVWQVPA